MAANHVSVRRSRISGSRQEMRAKFPGICRSCKEKVYPGDSIFFFIKTRKVEHYNCATRRNHTAPASLAVPREAIPILPPGKRDIVYTRQKISRKAMKARLNGL